MRVELDAEPPAASPIRPVVTALEASIPGITLNDVMLVGAQCRDLWHIRCGGDPGTLRTTSDVDLGLACATWETHSHVTDAFEKIPSSSGIRYRIGGLPVDVMPFGGVEDPPGSVTPLVRREKFSVWAFSEAHTHSVPLPGLGIRIASIPGYTALKACAWLDRSAFHETKDATDLALAFDWYATLLTDPWEQAPELMEVNDYDPRLAAAHLLGRDTKDLLGPVLTAELLLRWTGDASERLLPSFTIPGSPQRSLDAPEKRAALEAFTRGLTSR